MADKFPLRMMKLFGQSLLLSVCATLISFHSRVNAAQNIILQYQNHRTSITLQELQNLTIDGKTSQKLQDFMEKTSVSPQLMATLLNTSIPDNGTRLTSVSLDFLLTQLNKIVGEPLGRENLEPLRTALYNSYADGNMTFLELAQRYPKSEVRLQVNKLETVFNDAKIFVERIEPLLGIIDQLLPELLCECELESEQLKANATPLPGMASNTISNELKPSIPNCSDLKTDQKATFTLASTGTKAINPTQIYSQADIKINQQSLNKNSINITTPSSRQVLKEVVMIFGPFRRSFSLDDLTTFAETGEFPSGWKFYFNIAKLQPEDFRNLLTKEFKVKFQFLDKTLNSLLGEYILFQVGQMVRTPSRKTNIQALRSALVLSAINDNRISMLEVLQNYPAEQIMIQGINLTRFASSVKKEGVVKTATSSLVEQLVLLQGRTASQICNCSQPQEASTPKN